MPPAVIAGAYQTGVLGARSLRRRGVATTMFDCVPGNPGFGSVYGPAERCPDPDAQPEEWLRYMRALAARIGERAALIPSSDKFVTAMARHADALDALYLMSPGIRLQGQLADKHSQYALAQAHGMPMPLTRFVSIAAEVQEFAAHASYPCLVKPVHFREWQKFPADHPLYGQKIALAGSAEELLRQYQLAASVTPDVILQEIIAGPDTAKRVYLSCYDRSGQRIGNAMFRELRCVPVGFGPASVSETVEDPETDAVCDAFLRSIGYSGVCEIEMKWDERDGCVKIIEANPRLSGGGDAAPYVGVDLCWIHYCDLVGLPVTPARPNGRDVRHIVLRADGEALPSYWLAGLIGWRDVLHAYRPPLAFYDLDWRDWRYSIGTVLLYARLLVRTVLKVAFRPRDRGHGA